MHGRRSLNLELTPLDPDLERNIRRARRAQAEIGDNQRNPREEQRRMKSSKMRELGTGSIDECMSCISLHHSTNCSHLLRSIPIRA
jgi:ribosomal protein L44E